MTRFFSFLFIACCITLIFSCQKEVSSENGGFLIAEGSLLDSNGNCLPSTVQGTFYTGVTPGKDTAYIQIEVNVTKTGSYSISSDFQDGLQFLDSGFFSNIGLNIIHLKPIGTPIIPDTAVFNFNFDSSFCSFTVMVEDSTGRDYNSGGEDTTGTGGDSLAQTGQWQFTQNSFVYKGTFDSASADISTGIATFLYLEGTTSTGDTSMSLRFLIPAANIQTGTYTTISNGIFFNVVQSSPSFLLLYTADGLTPGTDVTINVTSYNAATKEMKGTFSGSVQNSSGTIVPFTSGSFDVYVL